MKTSDFAHLLSAGQIGSLQLKNRIVVTAMGVSMAEPDGSWGARMRAYHEEQARGGPGLIISGATGVAWPIGGVQVNQPAISEDRYIEGIAAVADATHAHGAKFAIQLHHAGQNGVEDLLAGRPIWTPSEPNMGLSAYADVMLEEEIAVSALSRIKSVDFRVMSVEDIKLVVDQFAAATVRAQRAGVDGVEIHGGHGYILSSFLSPSTNRRTDAYGGPIENRSRFLLEVIAAMRDAAGRDYPIWVKLDSRELHKSNGITIEDAVKTARLVEQAGVDAITVTAYHSTEKGRMEADSNIPLEPGVHLPFAARIKASVAIPVIASGRVEPEVAERTIAAGNADFIAMGRKILSDPELPNKLLAGKSKSIRPCIYCYTCVGSVITYQTVRCAVNPELGFEYLRQPRQSKPRRIAVIGGGPGGMEAARRLDHMGHSVTLFEQGPRLGGTLRFAALGYSANEALLDWLVHEITESGVEVRLNTPATTDLLLRLEPDAVVVATGAIRGMPDIPGNDLPHVFSGEDMRQLVLGENLDTLKGKTGLLTRLVTKAGAMTGATSNLDLVRAASRQWMPLGDRIVIVGGELVGLELAEFLSERKRRVTVVDDVPVFGAGIPINRRLALIHDLLEDGVTLLRGVRDIRIAPEAVHFTRPDGSPGTAPADHVIVAKGATGNLGLADSLQAAGFNVFPVGDCKGVGYIEGAMRSALEAATQIDAQA